MICAKCQTNIPDGKLFCPSCGYLNQNQSRDTASQSHLTKAFAFQKWFYFYSAFYGIICAWNIFTLISSVSILHYDDILDIITLVHAIIILVGSLLTIISIISIYKIMTISKRVFFLNIIVNPFLFNPLQNFHYNDIHLFRFDNGGPIWFLITFVHSIIWYLFYRRNRNMFEDHLTHSI